MFNQTFFQVDENEFYKVKSDYDFKSFLVNAKTSDYTDLQDVLRPSHREYDHMGHQKEGFIAQCSFDREDCNITYVQPYDQKLDVFNISLSWYLIFPDKIKLNGYCKTMFMSTLFQF